MDIGKVNRFTVNELVIEFEQTLSQKTNIIYLLMQAGDVGKTFADIDRIKAFCGFKLTTNLKVGIEQFCSL